MSAKEAERRLERLLAIQRRLGGERDLAVLPRLVMREVAELLDADRSTLFLLDWHTMELRARFAEGMATDALVVPLRMGIVGSAILTRSSVNIANAYAHPYFNSEVDAISGYRTESLLATPMQLPDGRIIGGIELLNKNTGRFLARDERLAEATALTLAELAGHGRLTEAAARTEMSALRGIVGCDRSTVFLVDEAAGRLSALHADGSDGVRIALSLKLGIAGTAAVTKRTLLIAEVEADPRFDPSFDRRTGYRTRSLLCVPLLNPAGDCLGVVQAINKRQGAFDAEDAKTLEGIAAVVAIAIENAMLLTDHDRQFHSLLEALAASIDAKDTLTAGHSRRVADIAVAVARILGFVDEDLDVLRVAALLHDYGKIGIEDRVLKKDGKLDEAEYRHMQTHAALTFDILERIFFARKYRDVPLIAASHHERLDGTGYPRGLKAADISFMTRILTVADVFEALTADRHYRSGMAVAAALAVLDEGCGTKFDPYVVEALKRHLEIRP